MCLRGFPQLPMWLIVDCGLTIKFQSLGEEYMAGSYNFPFTSHLPISSLLAMGDHGLVWFCFGGKQIPNRQTMFKLVLFSLEKFSTNPNQTNLYGLVWVGSRVVPFKKRKTAICWGKTSTGRVYQNQKTLLKSIYYSTSYRHDDTEIQTKISFLNWLRAMLECSRMSEHCMSLIQQRADH